MSKNGKDERNLEVMYHGAKRVEIKRKRKEH
jgi:hypothetical protein